jgi:hypothetical protein
MSSEGDIIKEFQHLLAGSFPGLIPVSLQASNWQLANGNQLSQSRYRQIEELPIASC